MLIGDSHARRGAAGHRPDRTDNRYRLFSRTKALCPALDIIVRDGDLEYTECEDWRRQVMDEVSALDPSIIVISGSAGIGNYLVYRDQSHVTASCMRFLVPELSACCRSQPDSRFPSMGVVQ